MVFIMSLALLSVLKRDVKIFLKYEVNLLSNVTTKARRLAFTPITLSWL